MLSWRVPWIGKLGALPFARPNFPSLVPMISRISYQVSSRPNIYSSQYKKADCDQMASSIAYVLCSCFKANESSFWHKVLQPVLDAKLTFSQMPGFQLPLLPLYSRLASRHNVTLLYRFVFFCPAGKLINYCS